MLQNVLFKTMLYKTSTDIISTQNCKSTTDEIMDNLPTDMTFGNIIEMIDKDMFVPNIRVIMTDLEVRMPEGKGRSMQKRREMLVILKGGILTLSQVDWGPRRGRR